MYEVLEFTMLFDVLLAHGHVRGTPPHPGVYLIGAALVLQLGPSSLYDSAKRSSEPERRLSVFGVCWHVPRWFVLSVSVTLRVLAVVSLLAGIGGMRQ